MNTESLEYFMKVYEKKSLKAAARDLFITPQGLSKMIKQLEKDLETELFYRGAKGVEATEYGELAYARAKHICYLIEDLKKEVGVMSSSKGTMNILTAYSIDSVLPIDKLYSFSKEYPDIQMRLREVPDEFSIGKLFEDDEVDVGLVMVNERLDSCEYELILQGEAVVVVSLNHPLAKNNEISIRDLENQSLVLKTVGEGIEHNFVLKCLECGFTPNVEYEIGNVITAHRLCKSDGMVSISVDFIEEAIKDDEFKIIKLKEKIEQNVYLVTKKSTIESKNISLFKCYVKEYIANNIGPFNKI